MHILRHPLLRIAKHALIFPDGNAGSAHAIVLPIVLRKDLVNLLCRHLPQGSTEETGQAHLPLHEVAHQHHQVLTEALELYEITLCVLYLVAMLADAAVDLGKEIVADAVNTLYELAAMLLLGNAKFVVNRRYPVCLLEDAQVGQSTKIVDANLRSHHSLVLPEFQQIKSHIMEMLWKESSDAAMDK